SKIVGATRFELSTRSVYSPASALLMSAPVRPTSAPPERAMQFRQSAEATSTDAPEELSEAMLMRINLTGYIGAQLANLPRRPAPQVRGLGLERRMIRPCHFDPGGVQKNPRKAHHPFTRPRGGLPGPVPRLSRSAGFAGRAFGFSAPRRPEYRVCRLAH